MLAGLEEEFQRALAASKNERMEGNDAENRAEDKYDTRSTEANYLADGHARKALAASEAITLMKEMQQQPCAEVQLGALVEVAMGDECSWFFIGPAGGGLSVDVDGKEVTLITPASPLGSRLLGHRKGSSLEGLRVLRVL